MDPRQESERTKEWLSYSLNHLGWGAPLDLTHKVKDVRDDLWGAP
jgi:hypothetical protein